ncbi:MAG TPA: helix-turn-helix domain-containing protein, partial [Gaiellales bacterium]|nr:helix-turn-helix domain-containing protein [Gaiellales bacterium]
AGVGELPFHHRRAVRAAALGRSLHGPGRVWRFDDVEVYDALLGDGDPERLDRIRARVLGPLGPDLRTTLRVVSECGAGPAAGRLFVHRNTVRYRLRRIESLTGLRLDRAEDRLLCELALLYDRMTAGPAAAVTDPGGI